VRTRRGYRVGHPVCHTDLTGPRLRAAFARYAETRAAASVARARSGWATFVDLLVADGATHDEILSES